VGQQLKQFHIVVRVRVQAHKGWDQNYTKNKYQVMMHLAVLERGGVYFRLAIRETDRTLSLTFLSRRRHIVTADVHGMGCAACSQIQTRRINI